MKSIIPYKTFLNTLYKINISNYTSMVKYNLDIVELILIKVL